MEKSQTFEGGSIYCLNCLEVIISNTTFDQQQALIRGGAIFLKQTNETYFGSSFDKTHVFDQNSFFQCQSQQGGSIYLKDIQNTQLIGKNSFSQSKVIFFNETQPFYSYSFDFYGTTYSKTYDDFSSAATIGKGPAIFFDCPESQGCVLDLSEKTTMSDPQKIIGYRNQEFPNFSEISGIFYTEVKPNIPESLEDQMVQEFSIKIEGSEILLINDHEKIKLVQQKVQKIQNSYELDPEQRYKVKNYVNVTQNAKLIKLYSLDAFQSKVSSIFGDQPIVIVNGQNEIQFYDSLSLLTIVINKSEQYPIETRLIELDDTKHTKLTYQAKNGLFLIPRIYLQAMPGIQVNLTISVDFYSSGKSLSRTIQIKMKLCELGEIFDARGYCQLCQGPDLYILEPPRIQEVQECLTCQKDIFECFGGNYIEAIQGYQRIEGDTFVKCDSLGGSDQCLANNTCELGYEGFMCKQCQPNYFKDFDGTCSRCRITSVGPVVGIWILLIAVAYILQYILHKSQNQNNISQSFNLFKNLINYVILMSILSMIFENYWINKSNHFKSAWLVPLRFLYSLPYSSFEASQCQEIGEDEPQSIYVLNQTLESDLSENAQAMKSNLFIFFMLMDLSFFVSIIITVTYQFLIQVKPQKEIQKVQQSGFQAPRQKTDSISVENQKLMGQSQSIEISSDPQKKEKNLINEVSPRIDKKKKNKKKSHSSSQKRKISQKSQQNPELEGGSDKDKPMDYVQILNLQSMNQSLANSSFSDGKIKFKKDQIQKQLQMHQFSRFSLFLAILCLMISTQLLEQQFVFFACKNPIPDTSFNFYDTSIQCENSQITGAFVIFIIIWLVIAPTYAMVKGGAEYMIEYSGVVVKLVLLLVAKNVLRLNEFNKALVAAFVVTYQMIMFLILKQKRVQGESEKLLKLYYINQLDTIMYLTVLISAYIGLIQASTKSAHVLFPILLLIINFSFGLFISYRLLSLLVNFLRTSPKCVHLYMLFICFQGKSTYKENQKQMEKNYEKERKAEEQMRKIDTLIQHLVNTQQEIRKGDRKGQEMLIKELQVLMDQKEQIMYPSFEKKPRDEKQISKQMSSIEESNQSILDALRHRQISIEHYQEPIQDAPNLISIKKPKIQVNDFGTDIVHSSSTLENNRLEYIQPAKQSSGDKLMITINHSQQLSVTEDQPVFQRSRFFSNDMEEEQKTPAPIITYLDDPLQNDISFSTSLISSKSSVTHPASELIQNDSRTSMQSSIKTSITHQEQRKNDIELSPTKRTETILVNKYNVDIEGFHTRDEDIQFDFGVENEGQESEVKEIEEQIEGVNSNKNQSFKKLQPVLGQPDQNLIERQYNQWKENSLQSMTEAHINSISNVSKDQTIQESQQKASVRDLNPSESIHEPRQYNLSRQKQYSNQVRQLSRGNYVNSSERQGITHRNSNDYQPNLIEKSKIYSNKLRQLSSRVQTKKSEPLHQSDDQESSEATILQNGLYTSYNENLLYNKNIQREDLRQKRSILPQNIGLQPPSQSVSMNKILSNHPLIKESPYNTTKYSGQHESQPKLWNLGLTFDQQQAVYDLFSNGKNPISRYRQSSDERALSSSQSRQSPSLGPKVSQNVQLRQEFSNQQRKSKSQNRARPYRLEKYQMLGYDLKNKMMNIKGHQEQINQ